MSDFQLVIDGRDFFFSGKHGTNIATGLPVREFCEVDSDGNETGYRVWVDNDGNQYPE